MCIFDLIFICISRSWEAIVFQKAYWLPYEPTISQLVVVSNSQNRLLVRVQKKIQSSLNIYNQEIIVLGVSVYESQF